jgi:hypothetical protein
MAQSPAIGGFLPFEIGCGDGTLYPDAIAMESARAGFLHVLRTLRPARIWLPWYICDAMTRQATSTHIPIMRYALTQDWGVSEGVELAPGDCLVYINYFGLCEAQVDAVLRRFRPGQVLIDNAQALYSPPRDCLANLYSPRKFVGVPDGGYLVAPAMATPEGTASGEDSIFRCLPLLMRLDGQVAKGYEKFREAEACFDHGEARAMSRLTQALLSSIDYASVAQRRRHNFVALHEALGTSNNLALEPGAVPLAYPLIGAPAPLRQRLIEQGIFVPLYWPEIVQKGSKAPEFERFLAEECVALPCNQNCSAKHMEHVAALVRASQAR